MNGILFIDKPKGMTSFDVCASIRKAFNIKKVGHTGTLDPNATGLMIILLGSATKLSQFLIDDKKTYIANIKLGIKTDTLDIDGNILEERKEIMPDKELMIKTLNKYLGKSTQIPPMTSAIKINGKKLYEYQRKNIEVDIPERDIEIYSIELLDIKEDEFIIKCEVSKGTYIRSLVRDILNDLNIIGTLNELRRIKIDEFDISLSNNLEDIKNNKYQLYDAYEILSNRYEIYEVINEDDVLNGKKLEINNDNEYLLMCHNKKALAIYKKDGNIYRCVRGLL